VWDKYSLLCDLINFFDILFFIENREETHNSAIDMLPIDGQSPRAQKYLERKTHP